MATKSIRDSASEHVLLRLHENDVYATQVVPLGKRLRRAPWPPSPAIIPLTLRELHQEEPLSTQESIPSIKDSHRH